MIDILIAIACIAATAYFLYIMVDIWETSQIERARRRKRKRSK